MYIALSLKGWLNKMCNDLLKTKIKVHLPTKTSLNSQFQTSQTLPIQSS